MNIRYVFEKPETLVSFIKRKSLYPGISPIRIHKSMYLLYGYYQSYFKSSQNLIEGINSDDYPEELFPAKFIAGKIGPILESIYPQMLLDQIFPHPLSQAKYDPIILQFLDEMIDSLNEASDFSLVQFTYKGREYKRAWNLDTKGMEKVMDNRGIREDFLVDFEYDDANEEEAI